MIIPGCAVPDDPAREFDEAMARTMRDYWYYGLCLQSDLPLTGFPAWPAVSPGPETPCFVLRQGAVPAELPDAPVTNFRVMRDGQGQILIRFPNLFRVLISNEHEAVIELAPGAPMAEVESYLVSYIAGAILHRRRTLPLHASCVMAEGRAIVISGHSGRGKSTLATALARAGHALLSDDITVIRFDSAGRPFAIPGSPHSRLTEESARANAIGATGLREGRTSDNKKIWHRAAAHFDPVPLAALIRLDIAPSGKGPALARLTGPGAVLPLQELIYRFALGKRLGAARDLAHGALRLAASAPIFQLSRSQDFAALGVASRLVLVAAGAAPADLNPP